MFNVYWGTFFGMAPLFFFMSMCYDQLKHTRCPTQSLRLKRLDPAVPYN